MTAKEIKVGAVIGKTNPTGVPYEDVVTGAQAHFDVLNKKGGVVRPQVQDRQDDRRPDPRLEEHPRGPVARRGERGVRGAGRDPDLRRRRRVRRRPARRSSGTTSRSSGRRARTCSVPTARTTAPTVPRSHPCTPRSRSARSGPRSSPTARRPAPPTARARSATRSTGGARRSRCSTPACRSGSRPTTSPGAVQAMKDNDVDFVATCMDLNGEVNIKKALVAAGLPDVKFYAPQGYDTKTITRARRRPQRLHVPDPVRAVRAGQGQQGDDRVPEGDEDPRPRPDREPARRLGRAPDCSTRASRRRARTSPRRRSSTRSTRSPTGRPTA